MDNEKQHGCCGHSHGHAHDAHGHGCCGGCKGHANTTLSAHELVILKELSDYGFLPISRFVMSRSGEDEVRFDALAPVYINDSTDSMDDVKFTAALLSSLSEKGLVSLDYDEPLHGYDYALHRNSDVFRYFERTVDEGRKLAGFLCDTAELECGSVALTAFGENAASKLASVNLDGTMS